MGSDAPSTCSRRQDENFNPRSPDGERRSVARAQGHDERYFNPRSPDGERPAAWSGGECQIENFNPRSPDGERRQPGPLRRRQHAISIHAPRMGSDRRGRHLPGRQLISIHAPRMGSDDKRLEQGAGHTEISIHAPRMGSDVAKMDIFAHDMGKIIHFQH